ncbi:MULTISPECIES: methyltransferase family protein [Xanthomonas]|uniref:methyltransferase family protein n=1 Tax=Xanthomonas TaxID=338 RepID=UPI001ADA868A|nr:MULTISPECIES: isoprenylcysteine carboxylmethyltransferase family protein [unclassified Xanthomonas]MBO9872844.1 phosphatidylethanolamine N-methyltransferase family protein [Xanthomonas sp. D-93]WNH44936.1 isoprenylcysteine carboxylmethyltransferase family protein [Xanthomonas sp. A6251]
MLNLDLSHLLFWIACAAWWAVEVFIGRRRRSQDDPARDGGTLRMLWTVLYAAIFVAVMLSVLGVGRWPFGWRLPLLWIGTAMVVGGLAFRLWAIAVLGRQFTVDVGIQPGHALITAGPYRWLRHPSYTGALLAFYGLALGMGNVLSLLAIVLPVTWAFLRRIRVEEAMLTQAFPEDYPDYAAHSWRLLPWVW